MAQAQRINVTVPEALLLELRQVADYEGRSLSGLCCRLLEKELARRAGRRRPAAPPRQQQLPRRR